jgi:hypothetical protein
MSIYKNEEELDTLAQLIHEKRLKAIPEAKFCIKHNK